jgi:hypothetical protein
VLSLTRGGAAVTSRWRNEASGDPINRTVVQQQESSVMVAIHDFEDPGSSQNRLPGKKMIVGFGNRL